MVQRRGVVIGAGFLIAALACADVCAFEFGKRYSASITAMSVGGGVRSRRRGYYAPQKALAGVEVDVAPEECRFYLSYEYGGKKHDELLEEARTIKEELNQRLRKVSESRIKLELCSYDPDTQIGSLFSRQRVHISLQFRIAIKLSAGEAKESWDDAMVVAKVLDVINQVRQDKKLGKALKGGEVRYAVESIEPARKKLLEKVEKEISVLKASHARTNGIKESELYCDVEYGEIYTKAQTLEKATLVLPYTVSFELKEKKAGK